MTHVLLLLWVSRLLPPIILEAGFNMKKRVCEAACGFLTRLTANRDVVASAAITSGVLLQL